MKLGFIGLGIMGSRIARNLIRAGHGLVVFDINSSAMSAARELGAEVAGNVPELASRSDVIFASLPGPPQVEEVMIGKNGVVDHVRPDTAVFDLSTSSPGLATRIASRFADRQAFYLDSPVSGGAIGAESGALAVWVGGDKGVYEKHLPILKVVGNAPKHVGPVGAGTIVKLSNNMTGFVILHMLAETFSLGVKAGVDPVELWEALRGGTWGRTSCLDLLVKQFLPGNFTPKAFALDLAKKDLSLALAAAQELGVPLRLAPVTMAELTEASEQGLGDRDLREFMTLQLERANVSIAAEPERLKEMLKRNGL